MLRTLGIALLCLAALTSSRVQAEAPTVIVKQGDALSLIAQGAGVSVEQIKEWNHLNGDLIRIAEEAKPVVVVYTDGVEPTGSEDIFAAISRDDGNTFKRTNISRAADRSSFTLANETEFYGQAKKPVFQVKGNNILVAWTSKFCNGGKPRYAITTCDDPVTEEVEVADPNTGLCRVSFSSRASIIKPLASIGRLIIFR